MHISFLKYLIDPQTGEELKLSIERQEGNFVMEGSLSSSKSNYPIRLGVPRFADYCEKRNSTESFGWQWRRWPKIQFESENVGKPMQGHTLRMWERITEREEKDLKGSLIADFGCGSGRFIEIVRMKKGRAIGIDLSDAVEVAAENFREAPDVLICQADIFKAPIKPESCDGVFSIGVLHHTSDPEKGFTEMIRCVRPGGWVALAVYGRGGYYDRANVTLYRNIFQALWPVFRHRLPLFYSYMTAYLINPLGHVPLIGKILRRVARTIFPFVSLPDIKWSV